MARILEGITRDTMIRIAREAGIPVQEGRFTRDELYFADEGFFTGTAAEVTPVREVDDRDGRGTVGPITRKIPAPRSSRRSAARTRATANG